MLLNDREPIIVLRNILLLMILGSVENINQAADIALHFWASAFIQAQHSLTHQRVIIELKQALRQDNSFSLNFGENLFISGIVSESTTALLYYITQREMQFEDATSELHRVRFATSYMSPPYQY